MNNHFERTRTHPYNPFTSIRSTNNPTRSNRNSQNLSRHRRSLQRNPHLMRRQNALRNRATGITIWQREVTNDVFFNSLPTLAEEENSQFYTNIQLRITDILNEHNYIDNKKAKEDAIEKRIEKFDSFIIKEASEENHCSICMDVEAKDVKMIRLTCSHELCKTCLKNWFINKLDCPTCRHKYSLQEDLKH